MRQLIFVTLLAACGVSGNSVCKKACSKSVACAGGTTQQITDCQTACDTTPVDLSGCANSGDILSCLNGCLDANCTDYGKCVGGCPKCVTNGQDLAMSMNNNSDMPNNNDDLAGSDYCAAFCAKAAMCGMGFTCSTTNPRMTCDQFLGPTPNACKQACITSCSDSTTACNRVGNCLGACGTSCP